MERESLKKKIIGTWKLVSWTYRNAQGEKVDFFGPNPIGILMYDASGYMNAQLMQSNGRGLFESDTLKSGTPEEIVQAYRGYAAYFGRYEERVPGQLTHIVEGSLQPNWIGQEVIRFATIEEDYLYLKAPTVVVNGEEMSFFICWRRAK